MLSEELRSVQAALGELMGKKMDDESIEILRQCRSNLNNAAEQVEELERTFHFNAAEKA